MVAGAAAALRWHAAIRTRLLVLPQGSGIGDATRVARPTGSALARRLVACETSLRHAGGAIHRFCGPTDRCDLSDAGAGRCCGRPPRDPASGRSPTRGPGSGLRARTRRRSSSGDAGGGAPGEGRTARTRPDRRSGLHVHDRCAEQQGRRWRSPWRTVPHLGRLNIEATDYR